MGVIREYDRELTERYGLGDRFRLSKREGMSDGQARFDIHGEYRDPGAPSNYKAAAGVGEGSYIVIGSTVALDANGDRGSGAPVHEEDRADSLIMRYAMDHMHGDCDCCGQNRDRNGSYILVRDDVYKDLHDSLVDAMSAHLRQHPDFDIANDDIPQHISAIIESMTGNDSVPGEPGSKAIIAAGSDCVDKKLGLSHAMIDRYVFQKGVGAPWFMTNFTAPGAKIYWPGVKLKAVDSELFMASALKFGENPSALYDMQKNYQKENTFADGIRQYCRDMTVGAASAPSDLTQGSALRLEAGRILSFMAYSGMAGRNGFKLRDLGDAFPNNPKSAAFAYDLMARGAYNSGGQIFELAEADKMYRSDSDGMVRGDILLMLNGSRVWSPIEFDGRAPIRADLDDISVALPAGTMLNALASGEAVTISDGAPILTADGDKAGEKGMHAYNGGCPQKLLPLITISPLTGAYKMEIVNSAIDPDKYAEAEASVSPVPAAEKSKLRRYAYRPSVRSVASDVSRDVHALGGDSHEAITAAYVGRIRGAADGVFETDDLRISLDKLAELRDGPMDGGVGKITEAYNKRRDAISDFRESIVIFNGTADAFKSGDKSLVEFNAVASRCDDLIDAVRRDLGRYEPKAIGSAENSLEAASRAASAVDHAGRVLDRAISGIGGCVVLPVIDKNFAYDNGGVSYDGYKACASFPGGKFGNSEVTATFRGMGLPVPARVFFNNANQIPERDPEYFAAAGINGPKGSLGRAMVDISACPANAYYNVKAADDARSKISALIDLGVLEKKDVDIKEAKNGGITVAFAPGVISMADIHKWASQSERLLEANDPSYNGSANGIAVLNRQCEADAAAIAGKSAEEIAATAPGFANARVIRIAESAVKAEAAMEAAFGRAAGNMAEAADEACRRSEIAYGHDMDAAEAQRKADEELAERIGAIGGKVVYGNLSEYGIADATKAEREHVANLVASDMITNARGEKLNAYDVLKDFADRAGEGGHSGGDSPDVPD